MPTSPSSPDDFSAPDGPGDREPSPLRRLVLAQLEEPGGAAVRLLTPTALAHHEPLGPTADDAARELGLDPAALELFGADGYLLQSALGEQALADGGVGGGVGGSGSGPVVALNYHDVPAENRPAVEERLRRLRDLGPVLDPDQPSDDARVVVAFYDSYREAALFGAEVCQDLGLRAWFFPLFRSPEDEPGAADLRDDELADIARAHELCFHTASHTRVEHVTEDLLDREVRDVHARLTELGGRPPRLGAWLGGSRWDEQHAGNRALRELGVRHLVSNWSIEPVPPPT